MRGRRPSCLITVQTSLCNALLLLRFREFSGSNLGPETGYSDLDIPRLPSGLFSVTECLKIAHDHFLTYPSQFIFHSHAAVLRQINKELTKC